MQCDEVQDFLEDYVAEELGGEVGKGVARHLQSCAACRSALLRLTAEQHFFKNHIRPELPPAELRRRLEKALLASTSPFRRSVRGRRLVRVAAALLVAVGLVLLVRAFRTPRPQRPARAREGQMSVRTDQDLERLLAEIKALAAEIDAFASQPAVWDDQMGRFPRLTPELSKSHRHLVQQAREGLAAQQLAVASQRNAVGDIAGSRARREFVTACLFDTAVGSGSLSNRERSKP